MKKILIVDYDADFVQQARKKLTSLFDEITDVETLFDMRKCLQQNRYDFIILSGNVSDGNAINECYQLKTDMDNVRMQIVIVDETHSEINRVASFLKGAVYYFAKQAFLLQIEETLSGFYHLVTDAAHGGNMVLLLAEDDTQRFLLKGLLELAGIKVYDFNNQVSARKFIHSNEVKIDIFIIDCLSEVCSEFIEHVRDEYTYRHTPIVVVPDEKQADIKYKLFLKGATDFIDKPLDICELYLKLKTHLKVNYFLEMSDAKNKLLTINATTDELTGLFNRRFFWEMLKREASRYRRTQKAFAVVIFDIDDFKKINDTHGHVVGDKVLQEVSECMKETVRKSDIVSRFGGEEFILLLPETSLHQAFIAADKIRKRVSDIKFDYFAESVTVSAGISEAGESEDYESLIIVADERLYKGKKTGKNRVVYD